MTRSPLSDITFDEQDANLFLVEDARLRADALKHSVLPRLQVVMNESISAIRNILGIEALNDSIISVYPNFRTKRTTELQHVYEDAFVGLGGQRKPKWPGFSRDDGKVVQILPFRFAFRLTYYGISINLDNGWVTGLSDESFKKILNFHLDNEEQINILCFDSGVCPDFVFGHTIPYLSPLSKQYHFRLQNRIFDNHFLSHTYHFPVQEFQLKHIIASYVKFFPVYDSYIQIAKGQPLRLDNLIDKLNDWLQSDITVSNDQEYPSSSRPDVNHIASLAAEQRVRVMPAIRWQVFQRDRWKCVACGRTSHDNVILHIDHIIPRSRGGSDTIDNYQTLCNTCNLGKGNRDDTDLRK